MTIEAFFIVLGLLAVVGWHLIPWRPKLRRYTQRGRKLRTIKVDPYTSGKVRVGPTAEDPASLHTNVLITGVPRSGKTNILKVMLHDVAKLMDGSNKNTIFILDLAREMPSYLHAVLPSHVLIDILTPTDVRRVSPDFAGDLRTPMEFFNFANKLCPKIVGDRSPVFQKSAAQLLTRTFQLFNKAAPGAWLLRDPLAFLHNKGLACAVFAKFPEYADAIVHLVDNDMAKSVYATLISNLAPIEPVAACWAKATKKISLKKAIREERAVILGVDAKHMEALSVVYAHLFDCLADEILSHTARETHRVWLFLDEIRQLQKMNAFSRVSTLGGKSGAVLVSTLQDTFGLESVYSKELASEAIACHLRKIFLRLGSESMSSFGSLALGQREVIEVITPRFSDDRPVRSVKMVPNVTNGELLVSPLADGKRDRIFGHVTYPMPARFVMPFMKEVAVASTFPNYIQCPDSDQEIGAFTLDDAHRVNFPLTDDVLMHLPPKKKP